ncbi:MAG TPA: tRNA pseudouridine(38-40) synthase TruA [Gemmatimonadales bacterium]|jgi:tRNA pseudouridine38-40 synthase
MDRTVCARLQYDGTDFVGWQVQPEARTVQGELEAVLGRLCGRPIRVHAAGRTDAGVHALGMAVSAIVPARWTPDALRRALNALLPPDCWVLDVRETQPGFHARTSADERSYCYRIGTDPAAFSPFRRPFEWALGQELPFEVLARQAAQLVGPHDFRALAVHTGERRNCRCTIRRSAWTGRDHGTGVEFHVTADRFLHHLVRILVATMVDAALGRRPEDHLARLLALDPDVRASPPAPPQGLYFMRAAYPDRWFRLDEDSP